MVRKLAALLAVVAATLFVAPAVSSAQPDYSGCVLTINPTQLQAGGTIQVNGSGFQPNRSFPIFLDRGQPGQQNLGTATSNASGSFSGTVTLPASLAPGPHTISAECGAASGFAQTTVQVLGTSDVLPDLTLSKSVVRRLETFVATVVRAQPNSTVTFAQLSTRVVVGSAVADAQGTARLEMSFPATATLGDHQVEAVGTDFDGDPFTLRDPIKVVADSVPRTGSDVGPQVAAGVAAVLVGAALVVVSRRRRAAHAAG
jgi:hypothetical protein